MATEEKMMKLAEKGKVSKLTSFAKNKKPEVRALAATALGAASGDDAFNQLVLLLMDDDKNVRISAAKGLGALGNGKAREQLRHAANQSDDAEFQEAVKHAMGMLPASN